MREKTVEKPQEKKKLEEAFALWKNKSKAGNDYLAGKDLHGDKLVGYFNSNKKNPKEPDVRVYSVDADGKQDKEVASLWSTLSKKEEPYLTGMTSDKEKLVAWFDKEEKHPYIKAYFKED